MEKDTEKDPIRLILEDYRSGKLDKYEAMEALELDELRELFALLAKYGVGPELTRDLWQSNPSGKSPKDYFTEGD